MIKYLFLFFPLFLVSPAYAAWDSCEQYCDITSCKAHGPTCAWISNDVCGLIGGLCANGSTWVQNKVCQLPQKINLPVINSPRTYNSFSDYTLLSNLNSPNPSENFWVYWDKNNADQNIMTIRSVVPNAVNYLHNPNDIVSTKLGFRASMEFKTSHLTGFMLKPQNRSENILIRIDLAQALLNIFYLDPSQRKYVELTESVKVKTIVNNFNQLSITAQNNQIAVFLNGSSVLKFQIPENISDPIYNLHFYHQTFDGSPVPYDFQFRNLTLSPLSSAATNQGDINGDGKINILDFAIWKLNYLKNKLP